MNTPLAASKSNFVNALAWILIAFGSFGVFSALMQNVMVNFVFPEMSTPSDARNPFPLTAFRIMAAMMLAVTVFITYAAIALLRRRNWARRTFVVLFVLGAAWNVIWIVILTVGIFFVALPEFEKFPMPSGTDAAFKVFFITFAVFALTMATLFAWFAKRLRSPAIRAEFLGAASVT